MFGLTLSLRRVQNAEKRIDECWLGHGLRSHVLPHWAEEQRIIYAGTARPPYDPSKWQTHICWPTPTDLAGESEFRLNYFIKRKPYYEGVNRNPRHFESKSRQKLTVYCRIGGECERYVMADVVGSAHGISLIKILVTCIVVDTGTSELSPFSTTSYVSQRTQIRPRRW